MCPYKIEDILNEKHKYQEKDIKEAADLMFHMISWEIVERYTAEECLNHPFLRDVVIEDASIDEEK